MSEDLIYGIHAVTRRLRQAPQSCRELICAEGRSSRLAELVELAAQAGIGVTSLSRGELSQRCGSDKHQGCLLLVDSQPTTLDFGRCLESIHPETLLLVLDGVQDPHNLGACLRNADACGVDAVIIPKDRAVKLTATVRKVAAGAADTVPLVEVTNVARSLKDLQQAGVWVYGASDSAEADIYQQAFTGPVALVMGAEGAGLRRLTRETCDHLFRLPMLGRVESLNVSVATGVCLYEILRSRNANRT